MKFVNRLVRLEKMATASGAFACPHCRTLLTVTVRDWLVLDPESGDFKYIRDPLCDSLKELLNGWRDDNSWNVDDLRCRWCGKKPPVILMRLVQSARFPDERALEVGQFASSAVTNRPLGNTNCRQDRVLVADFMQSGSQIGAL